MKLVKLVLSKEDSAESFMIERGTLSLLSAALFTALDADTTEVQYLYYMYLGGGTVGYCRRTERVRAWSLLTSLFGRCPHACWLHLR